MTKKTIYTLAGAHLDTVWNWEFEKTIRSYIPATLRGNFALFEKYPDYKFNFEGSFRYELMQEYYPEEFEKLKKYVAEGRWYPCGSSFENGDVNVPSPEALFRNILFGNGYFDKTFGIRSRDIYLPDCFGFGWTLPSIAAHANLNSFMTQKLTWGCVNGIPFDTGRWIGINGDEIFASVNPGGYGDTYKKSYREAPIVRRKLQTMDGEGHNFSTLYYGTGDIGGCPQEIGVKVLEEEIAKNDSSDVEIVSATVNQAFDRLAAMSDQEKAKLPVFNGELTMVKHGPGSYTSRAIGKRWNRRNENLAAMAESAAVSADINGAQPYPKKFLERAWKRTIQHQFHDDITGTSTEKVYKRSWNDYGVSLNQFAASYRRSAECIAELMDTQTDGYCVMVHNPLDFERKACVTIDIPATVEHISVTNAKGEEVPSQVVCAKNDATTIDFIATTNGLTYEVYTIKAAQKSYPQKLAASGNTLENQRYKVTVGDNGSIASIYDKKLDRELLKSPIDPVIFACKGSHEYPAWEVIYADIKQPARHVAKADSIRIIENGGAKVALEVVQSIEKSKLTSIISLIEGGDTVDVQCSLDWRNKRTMLKMNFNLVQENPKASFDVGLGYLERGNANANMYEVHGQRWADLSNQKGGVSILSDCKYAWDKPADDTIRMTVVQTPLRDFRSNSKQSFMDMGLNLFGYSIYSHDGAVDHVTQQLGTAFSTPVSAFECAPHSGELGKEYTYGSLSDVGVTLGALKKQEDGDAYVVRFYENENKAHKGVKFTLGDGITTATEAYASEEYKADAIVKDGAIVFDLKPFEVKTFIFDLDKKAAAYPETAKVELKPTTRIATENKAFTAPIDGVDFALPAEILPQSVTLGNLVFPIQNGATAACGQTVKLPDGAKRLHLLASALKGDVDATFTIKGKPVTIKIASAVDAVAKWDLVSQRQVADVKTDEVAHEFTHSHGKDGDLYAKLFYLFHYTLDVEGTDEIILPDNKDVLVFSAVTDQKTATIISGTPLYDIVKKREYVYDKPNFIDRLVAFRRRFLPGEIK